MRANRRFAQVLSPKRDLDRSICRNESNFNGVSCEEILEENQAAIIQFEKIISLADDVCLEDVLKLVNLHIIYGHGLAKDELRESFGLMTLNVIDFFPSKDLNGHSISGWECFAEYIGSLHRLFQSKEGLEKPWCFGYLGRAMPPQYNDILQQICYGF